MLRTREAHAELVGRNGRNGEPGTNGMHESVARHSELDGRETVLALSVVVPTRNEAGNIQPLVRRLEKAVPAHLEVIFVDDSDDETPSVIESVAWESECAVKLVHREPGKRDGGLGGAVVEGLRAASFEWVCVMDGDLQHPPELVPQLMASAERHHSDLVVASRYRPDGEAEGLSTLRKAISRASTLAARAAFPVRLRKVTDPMSGFFLVRRSALDLEALRPKGFKILLEILVRSSRLAVSEVGFEFQKRGAGESKGSIKEGVRYLSHLAGLRLGSPGGRVVKFGLVGLSGIVVNSLALAFATEVLGLFYLLSLVLATQCSTLWNFALTEIWVFGERGGEGRLRRLVLFALMNNGALLLRGPMVYLLTSVLAIYYVVSNLISLVALMALRYVLADGLIWRKGKKGQVHCYDIHGLVSVSSQVKLPELESFRVEGELESPTISVRTGWASSLRGLAGPGARRFRYDEGLGPLGFRMDVEMGEAVEVVASPLLARSPHVLYTNVVEPILRWTFVRKGYALVHAACVAFGEEAYLVTARTDTGKTTTILKLLSRQRRREDTGAFISDDLTLVSPEGRVYSYPKPLTISNHTVAAVRTAELGLRERLGLMLQSRLHSRSGRKAALAMTRSRLPMATINAVVQWLVPPPKYHVQRLVPGVRVAREARLCGMYVIERGGDGIVELREREALELLLSNCEDAYGFPPYPVIKGHLYGEGEGDLRGTERQIISSALSGLPASLIRSSRMAWFERIASVAHSTPRRPASEQSTALAS